MTAIKRKIIFQCLGGVAVLLLASLIAGIVVGYLSASGVAIDANTVNFWLMTVLATVLMVGAIWIGVLWMRSIDEAAREAHKAAWYWGGTSGMAVGGVFMILSVLPGAQTIAIPAFLTGRTDPAVYAAAGAFAIMSLMIVGYTIVWAWWWLARR